MSFKIWEDKNMNLNVSLLKYRLTMLELVNATLQIHNLKLHLVLFCTLWTNFHPFPTHSSPSYLSSSLSTTISSYPPSLLIGMVKWTTDHKKADKSIRLVGCLHILKCLYLRVHYMYTVDAWRYHLLKIQSFNKTFVHIVYFKIYY